ncbi:hypothetical protein J5N97_001714 [Dioscorea zingiberensis]|uniref:RNase H type-1 domain-containing protein n=1 Tax=Dioscorea zingiberensis TaxID=325984 RepID=A0A9D5BVS8_9LILI|nr:hypothetical protein J5N97_001714 [Dioscorea zingiberensis]
MASVAVVPYQQYWISADDKDVEWHEEWEVGEDFADVNQEEDVLVYEVHNFSWMKPLASHVKINCDASLAKKGVGCGYIMRDDEGRVIFGKAIKVEGVKTVVAAELAAIHLACFRAQDFGMKFVWLESDSLVAVNLINGIFAATLEDRDILRKDWLTLHHHLKDGFQNFACKW